MKLRRMFLFYIITLVILVGCSPNKKTSEFKKKDKAPEDLGKLSESFDKILKDVDTIEKINLGLTIDMEESKDEKTKGGQGGNNSSGSNSGGGSKDGGAGGGNNGGQSQGGNAGSQDKKPEVPKDEKLKLTWKSIDDTLESAHNHLNKYEAQAMKKGITQEKRELFEVSINKMTKAIENRSIVDIYDFGSQSILNLKSYYDLYQDEIGGDVSTLKYVAYQSYLRAISDDIPGALNLFKNSEENINKIRLKLDNEKDKIKTLDMVNNSLNDMKKALEEKSKRLYMIKKDIIIKNLNELE